MIDRFPKRKTPSEANGVKQLVGGTLKRSKSCTQEIERADGGRLNIFA